MRTITLSRESSGIRPAHLLCAFAAGAISGAACAYFMDADRGRLRRHEARDQLGSRLRETADDVNSAVRAAANESYGLSQRLSHAGTQEWSPPNDATLKEQV